MRDGWTYKKLGEVCEIVGRIGFRGYKREDYVESEELGAISLSPSNIIDGKLDLSKNTYISWEKYEESPEIMIFEGDVLLVKTASVGKSVLIDNLPHKATINPQFVVFKKIEIYNKFLSFLIKSNNFQSKLKSITSGSSVPTLSQKALGNLEISYPDLDIQHQIVSELDLLTHILDQKRQQLKEYDALAESIFYDMFGDPNNSSFELTTISELSEEKLTYGSTASAIPFDGKIRYLRITDILPDGSLSPEIMSPSVFDEKYILEEGDILFARSGATVGKTYCYKETDGKGIYAGYLIRMKPNKDKVLPLYIYYFTRTAYYKAFIEANSNAVAQPNVNAKQYGGLKLPLPPLPLQQTFAAKIQSIEHQKQLLKESIKETEMLFQSRMDYWFNG